jgi:hypothetical protein
LDRDDGESIVQWVDRLHVHGEILGFKSGLQPAPKGSGLDEKAFILMVQTTYQKEVFKKYGNDFMGIDATHNTTYYKGMNLFTIMVRDHWGHGKQCQLYLRGSRTEY